MASSFCGAGAYTVDDLIGKQVTQTIFGSKEAFGGPIYHKGNCYFERYQNCPDSVILRNFWGKYDLKFGLHDNVLSLALNDDNVQVLKGGVKMGASYYEYMYTIQNNPTHRADEYVNLSIFWNDSIAAEDNPKFKQRCSYFVKKFPINGTLTGGDSFCPDDIYVTIDVRALASTESETFISMDYAGSEENGKIPDFLQKIALVIYDAPVVHNFRDTDTGEEHTANERWLINSAVPFKDGTGYNMRIYNFAGLSLFWGDSDPYNINIGGYQVGGIFPCQGKVRVKTAHKTVPFEGSRNYLGFTRFKALDKDDFFKSNGEYQYTWYFDYPTPFPGQDKAAQTGYSQWVTLSDGWKYISQTKYSSKSQIPDTIYARCASLDFQGIDGSNYAYGTYTATLTHGGEGELWAKADGGTLATDAVLDVTLDPFRTLFAGQVTHRYDASELVLGPYDATQEVGNSLTRFGAGDLGVYVSGEIDWTSMMHLANNPCQIIDHIDVYMVPGQWSDVKTAVTDPTTGLQGAIDITQYVNDFCYPELSDDFYDRPVAERQQWLADHVGHMDENGRILYNQLVPPSVLEQNGLSAQDFRTRGVTTFAVLHYAPKYAIAPTFHALASMAQTTTDIDDILADDASDQPVYYDLQGRRVSEPLVSGTVYLCRHHGRTTKTVAQ